MVTLARVLAHLSPVQRAALFDALVSDAVGAVEANDLVPIDPAGAVPYAAVTPAAKSAHALRLRVANLEAALERAEADAADARREHRAAVTKERAAVVAALVSAANAPHPIERGIPSLSPAGRGLLLLWADRIERGEHRAGQAGLHRPGGDP
jgi:hypothetical protein